MRPADPAPAPRRIWVTLEASEVIELKRIALDHDADGAVAFFRNVVTPHVRAAAATRASPWTCQIRMWPMGIYLDNAATSWPKPEAVYLAVEHFMREVGATPGRGGHRREEEAARIADEARMALAQLFNAPDPAGVAFTMNATQAINMALKGLLQPGDHVITSSIEHNAMWRPLKALERRGVAVTAVPCASDGTLDPADVEAAIRPNTRLIAMLHASNVLGTILPIGEIGRIAHDHGIPFLVDAAQTAGVYPLDMDVYVHRPAGLPRPQRAVRAARHGWADRAPRRAVGDVGRRRVGDGIGAGDDA